MATRTSKGPTTGPIKKKGPHRRKGNPIKDGKIFGNWQERSTYKQPKGGK
jgi:hypothetical protein